MKPYRIGVRISAELHALLSAAGDVSAATQALAILGAAAVGYDLGGLRDEAAGLLVAPLDPPIRAALRGLIGQRSTAAPQSLDNGSTHVGQVLNTPTSASSASDDPLADVGIEV